MLQEPQHSVIIGSLLGDACLSPNGRYWRVRFDHSATAEGYLWWKYELLYPIVTTSPRKVSVLDRRTHRIYHHIRFDTRTLPELNWYATRFLFQGRKCVPHEVGSLLSPLALAVWYMDDGHRRTDCNALRLNTHAFTYENNEHLLEALRTCFDIRARLHRVVKEQWVLYIPSKEAYRFCNIIRRYVPPCMEYKLL